MTPADILSAMAKLQAMKDANTSIFMKYTDYDTASAYLTQAANDGRAVMIHGYLLVFAVCVPWHMIQPIIMEELVLRVHDTPFPVSVVTDYLDALKAEHGAAFIAAGDGQVGAMSKHYLASGYQTLGIQFIKE